MRKTASQREWIKKKHSDRVREENETIEAKRKREGAREGGHSGFVFGIASLGFWTMLLYSSGDAFCFRQFERLLC